MEFTFQKNCNWNQIIKLKVKSNSLKVKILSSIWIELWFFFGGGLHFKVYLGVMFEALFSLIRGYFLYLWAMEIEGVEKILFILFIGFVIDLFGLKYHLLGFLPVKTFVKWIMDIQNDLIIKRTKQKWQICQIRLCFTVFLKLDVFIIAFSTFKCCH